MTRQSFVSWWVAKGRQFFRHVRAHVSPAERGAVADWLTAEQLALFDRMHVADRRHGVDVVASLRAEGVTDEAVLLAGLLHDAGKGETGVWPRVAWSLGELFGDSVRTWAARLPGMGASLERLGAHAETSARLAEAVGCPPRTVELIRHQDAPRDPEFGELLRLADEAN